MAGEVVGQVVGGQFGQVLMRQKAGCKVELGELLVAETPGGRMLLQVCDLLYGSQVSQLNRELAAGLQLEEQADLELMEPHLRNYTLALLKNVLTLSSGAANQSKGLPTFFSAVQRITREDLPFLVRQSEPLFLGKLRSGSEVVDVDVEICGPEALRHHLLIAATTGRGKSNLLKVMAWRLLSAGYCGLLILDPHDEYYGRSGLGLKDHPSGKVHYYTPREPPPGARSLKIALELLRPGHFNGVVNWSDPQREALAAYHSRFGKEWVEAIVAEKQLEHVTFHEGTLAVVRRRLLALLDLKPTPEGATGRGIFDRISGKSTIADIASALEQGSTVIVDTSSVSGDVELLVGSLLASEVFRRYRAYKREGQLEQKPVISIVLEEAPRVLGKEVLERGSNVFSSIAREGRKFKIGLTAITQLPSLIPRDILANMNTKIVLGIEMAQERKAIIESAAQDLSADMRTIASLDVGEALITSNFARFATPTRIPLFEDIAKEARAKAPAKAFLGMR
ncbi:ATP-binding protein [Candidatus Woesearchaeota archaeon]|nr:ATP-binding protein [Candidatus Woesearchaeota archaeon]